MNRMTLRRDDVVVGVDTHKDEHVAVLLDGLGGRLAEQFVPATAEGFADLLGVAGGHVRPNGRLVASASRGPAPTVSGSPGFSAGTATTFTRSTVPHARASGG
jgi:hypothetical protein